MDWIIFGDDWGWHLSTTQHLAAEFPAGDRLVWVNSMGMRRPRFSRGDLRRALQKIFGGSNRTALAHDGALRRRPNIIVQPRILPWHTNPLVRGFNRHALTKQLRSARRKAGLENPHVVTTSPVAILYLEGQRASLTYLRLDDYSKLPGVDVDIVQSCEASLLEKADHIVVTARALLPEAEHLTAKAHYLPQGVDLAHYAAVPAEPPGTKVLGFFGLLAEWLDYDLMADVARACPDWSLEFVGPVRYVPADLRLMPNVSVRPPVSYADLPGLVAGWSAAWIPFLTNDLTRGVNPLKLREYLAAGLPSLSTPLPEAEELRPFVRIVRTTADVRRELDEIFSHDSPDLRRQRKESVSGHDWSARSRELRTIIEQSR